ncbi:MAG: hypothetical protein JWM41_1200 [Gemmatimonadetes bacterium]|nr:hypothetical protein [Gemmatimonadota bacterium]
MIGSIERLWQLVPTHQMVPVVMLVVGVTGSPDPSRRGATGYGGVLPVPSAPHAAAPAKLDPLLEQQRRDMRAARGRVLYSAGRAPQAIDAAQAKAAHKAPCPLQRVVQGRAARVSPTS